MKKIIFASLLLLLPLLHAGAQEVTAIEVPEGYELVDTVIFRPTAAVDTALAGKSVFSILPEQVVVSQSRAISDAFSLRVMQNSKRTISGYRVRIFFDNKQTARTESEEMLKNFQKMYPGISAYRSFANPFFKITVGDCRTRSEAMQVLEMVKADFPSAFILKENINYPVVDKNNSYVVDTLTILRPIVTETVEEITEI